MSTLPSPILPLPLLLTGALVLIGAAAAIFERSLIASANWAAPLMVGRTMKLSPAVALPETLKSTPSMVCGVTCGKGLITVCWLSDRRVTT